MSYFPAYIIKLQNLDFNGPFYGFYFGDFKDDFDLINPEIHKENLDNEHEYGDIHQLYEFASVFQKTIKKLASIREVDNVSISNIAIQNNVENPWQLPIENLFDLFCACAFYENESMDFSQTLIETFYDCHSIVLNTVSYEFSENYWNWMMDTLPNVPLYKNRFKNCHFYDKATVLDIVSKEIEWILYYLAPEIFRSRVKQFVYDWFKETSSIQTIKNTFVSKSGYVDSDAPIFKNTPKWNAYEPIDKETIKRIRLLDLDYRIELLNLFIFNPFASKDYIVCSRENGTMYLEINNSTNISELFSHYLSKIMDFQRNNHLKFYYALRHDYHMFVEYEILYVKQDDQKHWESQKQLLKKGSADVAVFRVFDKESIEFRGFTSIRITRNAYGVLVKAD